MQAREIYLKISVTQYVQRIKKQNYMIILTDAEGTYYTAQHIFLIFPKTQEANKNIFLL